MSNTPADEFVNQMIRWRTCREYLHREWSDGAVLYDTASGDTHHLTPSAFQILHLLQAPHTQEELTRCVLSSDSKMVDEDRIAMIDATLAHLVQLGLIESLQP